MSTPEFIALGDELVAMMGVPWGSLIGTLGVYKGIGRFIAEASHQVGLPDELRGTISQARDLVMMGGSYPHPGFQEKALDWFEVFQPIWEQSRGVAVVSEPGQWKYLGGKIWVRGSEIIEVTFGEYPSLVLSELLGKKPGEKVSLEMGTDADTIRKRVLSNCKQLGIEMRLRASSKIRCIQRK